jgi:hypothetical protein
MPLHQHTRLHDREADRLRIDIVRHARLVDTDLLGLRAGRGDETARALRIAHSAVFVPEAIPARVRSDLLAVIDDEVGGSVVRAILTATLRVMGCTGDPVDAIVDALNTDTDRRQPMVTALALTAPWLPFDDRWTAAIGSAAGRVDSRVIVSVLVTDGDPGDRRAWLDTLIRRIPRLERDSIAGPLADGHEVANPVCADIVAVEREVAARLGAILPATAEQLPLDLGRDAPAGSVRAARRALFGRDPLPTLSVHDRLERIAKHPLARPVFAAPPRRIEDLA